MPNSYITTREAAKCLGVSLRTAQQWLEKGLLKGWKTNGGHRRISRDSVEQMQRQLSRQGPEPNLHNPLPILIIDDDAALLKLYRAHLSRWPFDVAIHSAPSGYEGLVMVGELSPVLLICDLRLPGINGFQIVRSLCEIDRLKSMAVVVVSGLPPEEIAAHGGLPPRAEVLGKPVDFVRLQAIATRCHDAWISGQQIRRVRQC